MGTWCVDCIYSGHSVTCCYDKINLSPNGKYLASIDNSYSKIFIWRTSSPGDPLVMLGGRLEGLSDVSWCPEDELMVSVIAFDQLLNKRDVNFLLHIYR